MISIKEKAAKLPDSPGIYKFYDANGNILYIGKAKSIKKRVSSYFHNKIQGEKINRLIKKISEIAYIKVFSEFEALLLEAELIKKNKPFFNSVAKDDKSPLYIKITDDKIPLLTVARKQKPKRSTFLAGPFPSAKTTREVLQMIRKIYPYCHHKNPRKPCLFVHMGLCPYPYDSELKEIEYKKNILKIKKLLSGKSKQLVRQLTNEMSKYSDEQKYEKAQRAKEEIQKIEYVTAAYHSPEEYIEKPSLVEDITQIRLKTLKTVLKLRKIPRRIECYDISNIFGKMATGSMIVFTNGQPDKKEYRRFKIKYSNKPNDYEMLAEILKRRFKNAWKHPDLIIIDGGKGQLNTAFKITDKFKPDVTVISIAKKYEEIYTDKDQNPLKLATENPARQLVQSIRDEAHRFALTYHRLLRSKNMLNAI